MHTISEFELRLQNMGASDRIIKRLLLEEELGILESSELCDSELRNLIDRKERQLAGF